MVRSSLILLAVLVASCGRADHPFDRVARSLAEAESPAGRMLRGLPAAEASAAGAQAAPAADPKQLQRDAEALAEKHGFDDADDYRASYERMRLWKDFLGKQDRRAGARAEAKAASERAKATLAGNLPPAERERYERQLREIPEELARMDADEKAAPPGDDQERAAYERNRKVFEAADKRR